MVTDSAANMKVVWNVINEDFPHITVIGCGAQALNIFLSDVMSLRTMENLDKTKPRWLLSQTTPTHPRK